MSTLSNRRLSTDSKWRGWRSALAFINIALMATAVLTPPAQAAAPPALTLVSLTFDDGRTQSVARAILAKHSMQGTFYINSNLIGSGGTYLTKAELDALYADGNEIGGHTLNHSDLATQSDADQQAAICNDMQNLINWGYQVHSFAYPYGSTGPTTQSIVAAGCPNVGTYESARGVGGLVTGRVCFDCPWGGAIPPANPRYIPTNDSINSTTTLADLQGYVTQAETSGGGWVPLVFHGVCDACSTLIVSPTVLDAFLTWLEGRQAQSTYVRTVHQVMTGDYPPAPQVSSQLGLNMLINPSLEDDINGDNKPDCWNQDGYGSNTAAWTRTSDAHSGSFAHQLNITSYSGGDRKLLQTLDAGQPSGCAPQVANGELYQLSAWYKSTVQAVPVLFYLDATGVWQYWRDGPQLPATASWAQMTYYPGAAPAGAQAISFGIALDRVGTLTTDDYSMTQVLSAPVAVDSTPPVISGFAPIDGAAVTGTVALTAAATDNIVMNRVEFLINGTVVATDTTSPYAVSWNSTAVANGPVSYAVRAFDFTGNQATSTASQLTVFNDNTPPAVLFNQPPTPAEGAIVSSFVSLSASATDDVGVARVDFLVNGAVVGSSVAAPYLMTWNSLLANDGPATLVAKAFDAAGNVATTATINVTVSNSQAGNLLTNPSLEMDANNDKIADCWQRAGYGTNAFTWARLSGAATAHSGNFASSLQVTSLTSGDRKLVQFQDAGTCAPTVTAGARYTVGGWYKSTVPTGIVVYYRSSAGVWTYWKSSATLPAANDWAQASYTTPAIPAGATALSFGLYLNNVGTLVTDDYTMTLVP
jgi:peptidoglycan/xylan/chitin deacetylase (PgdA/CDA1 family)